MQVNIIGYIGTTYGTPFNVCSMRFHDGDKIHNTIQTENAAENAQLVTLMLMSQRKARISQLKPKL